MAFSTNQIQGVFLSFTHNSDAQVNITKNEDGKIVIRCNIPARIIICASELQIYSRPSENKITCDYKQLFVLENTTFVMVRTLFTGDLTIDGECLTSKRCEIWSNGSGSFLCPSSKKFERVEINIKGSGNLMFNSIEASAVTLRLQGSGNCVIETLKSPYVLCTVNGSGFCKISNIKAQFANFMLFGSGDIRCKDGVVSYAEVEVYGSGSVKLTCEVTTIEKSIFGSGQIS